MLKKKKSYCECTFLENNVTVDFMSTGSSKLHWQVSSCNWEIAGCVVKCVPWTLQLMWALKRHIFKIKNREEINFLRK